jgi:hypothetical protein
MMVDHQLQQMQVREQVMWWKEMEIRLAELILRLRKGQCNGWQARAPSEGATVPPNHQALDNKMGCNNEINGCRNRVDYSVDGNPAIACSLL